MLEKPDNLRPMGVLFDKLKLLDYDFDDFPYFTFTHWISKIKQTFCTHKEWEWICIFPPEGCEGYVDLCGLIRSHEICKRCYRRRF